MADRFSTNDRRMGILPVVGPTVVLHRRRHGRRDFAALRNLNDRPPRARFAVALLAGNQRAASNVYPESGGRHVVARDVCPRKGAKNDSQPREGRHHPDSCHDQQSRAVAKRRRVYSRRKATISVPPLRRGSRGGYSVFRLHLQRERAVLGG